LLELIEFDEEDRLIAEALIAEDVSQKKMCRKCFSGFGWYMRLQSTLEVHSKQFIAKSQEKLRSA